ncbi:MAG: DUF2283 domain-containing protein [Spirochaetia bacterium]
MIVRYDDEIDALYLQLGDAVPDGVIEIAECVNLDTTANGKIAGIEILSASHKMDINGVRHDIGNKLDFIKTSVLFGLKHADIGDDLREWLKELSREL